jgi:site-specific recombinase XerD
MIITLSIAITKYFEAKRAQRLSEHTLSDYNNTFRKFSSFLGEDRRIDKITSTSIAQFLANTKGVSKKTTLNYHTGLSSLWNYLVKLGYVKQNIVRLVDPPRPDERQVIPFNRDDIVKMLGVIKEKQSEIRNRAIILLLLDTGLRSSELCSLRVKDIDLITRKLRTLGKGRKERYIPFHLSTQEALAAYFKLRGLSSFKSRNKPVFMTMYLTPSELDRNGLFHIVEKIGINASIQSCHPHRFRHTFAIQFLRNGGNIYTLQALLGHTTLDMVKRYLAIAQTDLDSDHEKASPVKVWKL